MKKEELKNINFGDWPLPENILKELGRMHSLWNCMELTLIISISKLSGNNNIYNDMRQRILINNTTFQQKLDILSSLCEYLKNEFPLLSKYPKVISKLKIAQKNRNKYTHQNIVFNVDSQELELATCSVRGKLKTNVSKIEIDDLKKAVIDIDEANVALYELVFNRKLKPVWQKIIDSEKIV